MPWWSGHIEDAFSFETPDGCLDVVAWSDGHVALGLNRGGQETADDLVVRQPV
jgi:hypothetical protein